MLKPISASRPYKNRLQTQTTWPVVCWFLLSRFLEVPWRFADCETAATESRNFMAWPLLRSLASLPEPGVFFFFFFADLEQFYLLNVKVWWPPEKTLVLLGLRWFTIWTESLESSLHHKNWLNLGLELKNSSPRWDQRGILIFEWRKGLPRGGVKCRIQSFHAIF